MCRWIEKTAAWCIHQKTTLSSTQREPICYDAWQSPVSFFFITSVRCRFLAGLLNFTTNYLPIRLKTILELIDVHFKLKIAWMFVQDLFGERITVCFTERYFLVVVFRGRPDEFQYWIVPSTLNLTIALCTAVLEQNNSAATSLSLHPFPCKVTMCVLWTCQRWSFAHCMGVEMS